MALPGLHGYFKKASDEEREHAMKFLKYMNKRGGRIILKDIQVPECQVEMTAVEAMAKALELEKQVNEVSKILTTSVEISFVTSFPEPPSDSQHRSWQQRCKFL